MKLVRRARKNIRERRMKACLNDLHSNLSKVETKVFVKQKRQRERKRQTMGIYVSLPKSILAGRMTPELYAIECRLHEEVGVPRPQPYPEYEEDIGGKKIRCPTRCPRIGFLPFSVLMEAVNMKYGSQRAL